ncbi:MAG TPA: transposase family protein [Spirochaetes bacterium]|nr:transposase family protein [Spirochaetota bacterium]
MRKIKTLAPISKAFENLHDPRSASGHRHPLKGMLVLVLGAMLCGAKGPTAIAEWGKSQTREELKSLGFKRGISPSPTTFCRLFSRLDSLAFEQGLRSYFALMLNELKIDGKMITADTMHTHKGFYEIGVVIGS